MKITNESNKIELSFKFSNYSQMKKFLNYCDINGFRSSLSLPVTENIFDGTFAFRGLYALHVANKIKEFIDKSNEASNDIDYINSGLDYHDL